MKAIESLTRFFKELKELFQALENERPEHRDNKWSIGPVTEIPGLAGPNQTKNMNVLITDSQQVPLSVAFVDKRGNPAVPTSPPVWSASDATILTVTPATDGLSAVAAAAGPLGTAQVTVTTLATDGTNLIATADVQVVAGAAVSEIVSAGAPVEQAAATPPAPATTPTPAATPSPAPAPVATAPSADVAQ